MMYRTLQKENQFSEAREKERATEIECEHWERAVQQQALHDAMKKKEGEVTIGSKEVLLKWLSEQVTREAQDMYAKTHTLASHG